MRTYWTLLRRELSGFFLSISGYVIIAAALFLMGYSFVVFLVKLQKPTPIPVTELFYITPFFWLILLLTTPVIQGLKWASNRVPPRKSTRVPAPKSPTKR